MRRMADGNTHPNERLEIRYVRLDDVRRWNRNPKKHDLGALMQSIRKHGFKNPPKFEPALNNGQGGLVIGNGRDEALEWMEKETPKDPPRGIAVDGEGRWLVPIIFGVDAASQIAAEAYGVDDNNLTMMGGDFGAFDIAKMWDEEEYNKLLLNLAEQGEYAVSMPAETLVFMNSAGNTLLDYYKNKDAVKGIDSALADVLATKLTLLIKNRKHEVEAIEAIKTLINTHPDWEMEIA